MYIGIDFDGTLCDHRFPEIGPECPEAFFWLKRFQELGGRLILFTMRSDDSERDRWVLADAVMWCRRKGIEFYGVNWNPDQEDWSSSPKAYANVYIDDAAFGCPLTQPEGFYRKCVDWSLVGPAVEKMLTPQEDGYA